MIRSHTRAALFAVATLITFAAAPGAVAADAPPPVVDELLRQSGDTSGVWEADKKNRAHHVQSGLICDATFVSLSTSSATRNVLMMPLQSVSIVAGNRPRGDDVACNYGASNGPLVVVEAIRVNKGEDADDIFDDMRELLASKYDRFYHEDMILPVGAQAPGELARDLKYQNFTAKLGDKRFLATIWVGVVRGWAVVVYAVAVSDNIFIQHGAVNTQWLAAARSVLATSISRGEPAP